MSVCASVACFYIGTCAQWGSEHAVSAAFSHFLCPPRGLSVSHVFYETSLDPWCLQGNTIANVLNQTAPEWLQNTFSCPGGRLSAYYNPQILSLVLFLLWINCPWLRVHVTGVWSNHDKSRYMCRLCKTFKSVLHEWPKGMAKLKQQSRGLEFCRGVR